MQYLLALCILLNVFIFYAFIWNALLYIVKKNLQVSVFEAIQKAIHQLFILPVNKE